MKEKVQSADDPEEQIISIEPEILRRLFIYILNLLISPWMCKHFHPFFNLY